MSKSPEELLNAAAERAELALDNLAKVAGKVARTRVAQDERESVPAYLMNLPDILRQKLTMGETMLGAAVKQLYDIAMPIPLQMAGGVSQGAKLSDGHPMPSRPATPAQAAPIAVGRLSKNAEEPGAGSVAWAPPIVPATKAGRGNTGVGFIGSLDAGTAEIPSL